MNPEQTAYRWSKQLFINMEQLKQLLHLFCYCLRLATATATHIIITNSATAKLLLLDNKTAPKV